MDGETELTRVLSPRALEDSRERVLVSNPAWRKLNFEVSDREEQGNKKTISTNMTVRLNGVLNAALNAALNAIDGFVLFCI